MKRTIRRWGNSLMGITLMLAVTGCTQRLIDFTVISSKNTDMKVKPSGQGKQRTVGIDSAYWFIVPFGIPNMKEATDRAIESAGPGFDALIDGVVYSQFYYFLVGYSAYKVEGTPVKTAELAAQFIKEGKDVEMAFREHSIMYHSSLGKSNDQAFASVRVIPVKDINNTKISEGTE